MTRRRTGRARAWVELLRVSALFSVPGDALAGAAAAGVRPGRGTLCAIGASLCLYEAGMALNDWADRAEDAAERPHRPLPSGRIAPSAALAASAALTAAGLALASRAGRPPLAVATALAATVWAYDLGLKHTPAGPATMATARALDLLLGATASTGGNHGPCHRAVHALPSAALLGAHTYAVTAVSRHETQGGSTRTPLAALAVTLAVAGAASGEVLGARPATTATTVSTPSGPPAPAPAPHPHPALPSGRTLPSSPPLPPSRPPSSRLARPTRRPVPSRGLGSLLALAYARTPATLLLHAALNPSAALTERAVGGGIRATIPLQAALAARAGAPGTALALLGLVPAARALARKVSPT
ncbi:SCO3242 family prenyltransferase [Streptomyces sp. NPDC059556]|uniref:SCO3242 family prenyltransferase n=1 Tax=Streptomyces sp. NPDC059556 TaxID=3346863 RepID=UPI0036902E58